MTAQLNPMEKCFCVLPQTTTFIYRQKSLKPSIMAIPDFPNGFDSWQKTHFEVVEVLVYIRSLEEDKKPKSFDEAVDQTATEEMYNLALTLTNKYEELTKGKTRERSLFDEIEDFVWSEVESL
jgi:hypothetical protein